MTKLTPEQEREFSAQFDDDGYPVVDHTVRPAQLNSKDYDELFHHYYGRLEEARGHGDSRR